MGAMHFGLLTVSSAAADLLTFINCDVDKLHHPPLARFIGRGAQAHIVFIPWEIGKNLTEKSWTQFPIELPKSL